MTPQQIAAWACFSLGFLLLLGLFISRDLSKGIRLGIYKEFVLVGAVIIVIIFVMFILPPWGNN